jgi:hypothetical protein
MKPSPPIPQIKRVKVRHTFRVESILTGDKHFEGSQPDANRFITSVRNGKCRLPLVPGELRVVKVRKRPLGVASSRRDETETGLFKDY